MTNADRQTSIEAKVIYSIFQKRPKRADIYWFVHVETLDEPIQWNNSVCMMAPDDVIRITFKLVLGWPYVSICF
jgi:KUP system potassium uptake protein